MFGGDTRVQNFILKPEGNRPLAGSRHRWEYNIKIYLREMRFRGVD
jgi:hypothetical protein